MKKKCLKVGVFIVLLTELSTSSFFLSEYLTTLITKNEHSKAQLNFAIKQQNLTALNYAIKHSQYHSQQWLSLTKILAKTQGKAAFELALYYQKNTRKKLFWFKSASRLGYHRATLALAQHFFKYDNITKAKAILLTLTANKTIPLESTNALKKIRLAALVLAIKIAIYQGKVTELEQIIKDNKTLLKSKYLGQIVLNDIEKYKILTSNKAVKATPNLTLPCENSIQLFATRLSHLKYIEKIINDFKAQPLNHVVCFAPVRYIAINTLECSKDKNIAIACNELIWQSYADSIVTRYIGVMLPKGGANVHLGVLYFDSKDNVDVVAHEISHLLGFVDEYALKADHIACLSPQKEVFAQNIAILKNSYQGDQKKLRASILKQVAWAKYIKNSTPILQLATTLGAKQYWQLGTPKEYQHEIGIFKAQTCEGGQANAQKENNFAAYKGVAQRTQLQYFSLTFPKLYRQLLQDNTTSYRMPSFHYNIALAYFQQTLLLAKVQDKVSLDEKNTAQALYWLEQAIKWEKNSTRKKKIRQGRF